MELRIDKLLHHLRTDTESVLRKIDADPLLVKRTVGDLVLANATKELFTPQEVHQLFAKGIVYRREPWELVSLPLLKIYNLGERDVTAADIVKLVDVEHSRLHFLRKFDGTLIQRFQHNGNVRFTTRGMIEGALYGGSQDEDAPAKLSHFDFLGTTRKIANAKYPQLLEHHAAFDHLTLLLEFLHPETQVITNYGDRQDLVLLAAFDRRAMRYYTYRELQQLAQSHQFTLVDMLQPRGSTLVEQIDDFLTSLKGTDEEGTVVTIEHAHELVYRVKIKSPDYLKILKLVVTCTYARTVEMLDAHPEWDGWSGLESHLRSMGNDQVPEEVLSFYREHFDAFQTYLRDCDELVRYGKQAATRLRADLGEEPDARMLRKRFAERATQCVHPGLIFAAFDGRLDRTVVRKYTPSPEEARRACEAVGNP